MANALAIILAAGQGTRMNSDLPKVLFPACEKPMIHHVIAALNAAGVPCSAYTELEDLFDHPRRYRRTRDRALAATPVVHASSSVSLPMARDHLLGS